MYLRQLLGAVGDERRLRLRLHHRWSGHLELDRPLALQRLLAGLDALGADLQSIQRFGELRRQACCRAGVSRQNGQEKDGPLVRE